MIVHGFQAETVETAIIFEETDMSQHSVRIIEITEVRPHANAERLEIVPVDGWCAVVKKGQFNPGDRAIYIQPDYTVPTSHPAFSFLARDGSDRHRLKAVRLRGVLSYGLLIPVPSELAERPVGDDVMGFFGIERYEPPVVMGGTDELPHDQWPEVYASKFDIEALQNHPNVLVHGEDVIVTEKIHGASARYLYQNGVFYVGSRTRWLTTSGVHAWARAAVGMPAVKDWCQSHEGVVLYGEVYGSVQSLRYGHERGSVSFGAFAASHRGVWWDLERLHVDAGLQKVPVLYRGPWGTHLLALAEGDSSVPGAPPGHMREGIVIVPARERRDDMIGRVALKHISNRYWESGN